MLKKIMLSSVVTVGLISSAVAGGLEPQKKAAPVFQAAPVKSVMKAVQPTSKKAGLCGSIGATVSRVDADYKGPETTVDDKNYGYSLLCVMPLIFGFQSEAEVAYTKWIDETESYNSMGSPHEQATKITSVEVTYKAKQRITNSLSLYVRAGFARGSIKQVDSIPGMVMGRIKVTDTAPIFGIGLDYKLPNNAFLRFEHLDTNFKKQSRKASVDGLKLSLGYMFN